MLLVIPSLPLPSAAAWRGSLERRLALTWCGWQLVGRVSWVKPGLCSLCQPDEWQSNRPALAQAGITPAFIGLSLYNNKASKICFGPSGFSFIFFLRRMILVLDTGLPTAEFSWVFECPSNWNTLPGAFWVTQCCSRLAHFPFSIPG